MRKPLSVLLAAPRRPLQIAAALSRPGGRAAGPPPREPRLPHLPRQGHDPRRIRRALRGRREPGLRLAEVPRHARRRRPEPDPPLRRARTTRSRATSASGRTRWPPRPGRALVPWARTERRGPRTGGEVRPLAVGPRLLRAPARLRGRGGEARRRRRGRPVLLLLRLGLAVLADERGQQRERRRHRAEGEGQHPRQRQPPRRAGEGGAEGRRGAPGLRQRLLRDPERALGGPRGGRRRRERVGAPRGRDPAGRLLEEPGGPRGAGVARLAVADRRRRQGGGGTPRRPAPRRPELRQPPLPRARRRPAS